MGQPGPRLKSLSGSTNVADESLGWRHGQSMEARPVAVGDERDMGLQRRMQLEGAWLTCEVMQAKEAPRVPACLGDLQLVARDVEGRAHPAPDW